MSDWPGLAIRPADLPLIRQLMSEEEYRELLEAIGRLRIPAFREVLASIRKAYQTLTNRYFQHR